MKRNFRNGWPFISRLPSIFLVLCMLTMLVLSGCGYDKDIGQERLMTEDISFHKSALEDQAPPVKRNDGSESWQQLSAPNSKFTQPQIQRKDPTAASRTPSDDVTPLKRLSASNKPVKGIYVSGWVAGSKQRMNRITALIEQTDLNAMVIDVKNDFGRITYNSSIPMVKQVQADADPSIGNMSQLIQKLKEKEIYLIGRVVVFKDPLLAKLKPAWAIQNKNGGSWTDKKGIAWIDPYQRQVWDYNISIAMEAAALGFDEIQFDYVRFPDNGAAMDKVVRYFNPEKESKSEAIRKFLHEATDRLHSRGARVSADVFGLVTTSKDDMGIGQTWRAIAGEVDVISPMTYPSHYSEGMYGFRHPDLHPYGVVKRALIDAGKRNRTLQHEGSNPADIRPWLQGFTATWVHPHQRYGYKQIKEQINAADEQGIKEFLIWSAECRYDYRS